MKIEELKQKHEIYDIFLQLVQIPSPSLHEENVSDKILELLNISNISVQKDEYGNVIAKVQATDSTKSPLAFSAHMDVVGDDSPINVKISDDGKYIETDKKRTLGADDKAGVAAAVAIARNIAKSTITHGGLELIFTRDEEQNISGIKNLNPKMLDSKYILVLDSDRLGDIMTSGAGYTIGFLKVNTFKGGHSGIDIGDTSRANAVKLIAELVNEIPQGIIKKDDSGTITSINVGTIVGGGVDSAINKLIDKADKSLDFAKFIFENAVTNVINTSAYATYSIRSSSKSEEEKLISGINEIVKTFNEKHKEVAKAEFLAKVHMLPFEKSDDEFIVKLSQEAANEIGLKYYTGSFHAGAETHIYKYYENAKGEKMLPYLYGAANVYNMHSSDEKIEIESIEKGYEFLRKIFLKFNEKQTS